MLKRKTGLKTKTGLKRGTIKKRSSLKSKSKTPLAKAKLKLWEYCKGIIRKKYANQDGTWTCYTCDKTITTPGNAHTAHFIPSAACGMNLRYDLRNLRVCCYHCNVNLGGNGAEYYKRMVEREGQEYVDQIFADKNITVKGDLDFIEAKTAEYKELLDSMNTNKQ